MSSKGGRIKRTKNVPSVDLDGAPSLPPIIDEDPNIIPAGRQLERTPSKTEQLTPQQASKPGSPAISEQVVKDEPCGQDITKRISCNGSNEDLQQPKVKDERMSIRRTSSTAASGTPGIANPEIFIQGMQGYQWTDTDLEFVYQTKLKKQVQHMQQELSDVQKSLKNTRQMLDMALAARDKIQTELSKLPSCERIQQLPREIFLRSHSSSQLEGLDFKALIAKLKVADVRCITAEEKTEVSKLKTEVETAQVMREKEEQLMKDIDSCKENINQIKVYVHNLTEEISALESKMSGKEEAPQSTKSRQKVNRGPKPSAAPSALKPSKPLKAPGAPKPSKPTADPPAPKPSKPPALKPPKPPADPPAPKPSKPPALKPPKPPADPPAPKASKPLKNPGAPKPSKPTADSPVPKSSKPLKTPAAPKPSKLSADHSAPKPSKPSATLKSQTASKPSKATTGPKATEADVDGLRRSKRIAAKK